MSTWHTTYGPLLQTDRYFSQCMKKYTAPIRHSKAQIMNKINFGRSLLSIFRI